MTALVPMRIVSRAGLGALSSALFWGIVAGLLPGFTWRSGAKWGALFGAVTGGLSATYNISRGQ